MNEAQEGMGRVRCRIDRGEKRGGDERGGGDGGVEVCTQQEGELESKQKARQSVSSWGEDKIVLLQ